MSLIDQFDEIDKQVAINLMKNSRMPVTRISKDIPSVSTGTIRQRMNKMEDTGIIRGSTLLINYEELGFRIKAFLGIVTKSSETENVKTELEKIPNIVQLSIISGKYNFLSKIIAKDANNMMNVILEIGKIKGVTGTESMLCLQESINDENRLLLSMLDKSSFA